MIGSTKKWEVSGGKNGGLVTLKGTVMAIIPAGVKPAKEIKKINPKRCKVPAAAVKFESALVMVEGTLRRARAAALR